MRLLRLGLFIFLTVAMLAPHVVKAQFTYVGLGFEYTRTKFGGEILDNTINSGVNMPLSIMHRPIRNLGIGITYDIPFIESNKFGFSNDDNFKEQPFATFDGHYLPSNYDYAIERSAALTFKARWFMEVDYVNLYLDFRYTLMEMTETFTFQRPARAARFSSITGSLEVAALAARNISYNKVHELTIPGISFGMMPHISDNLYLDMWATADFLRFEETPFSYTIEDDWNFSTDVHEFETLTGQADGTKVNFSIGMGVGVFF